MRQLCFRQKKKRKGRVIRLRSTGADRGPDTYFHQLGTFDTKVGVNWHLVLIEHALPRARDVLTKLNYSFVLVAVSIPNLRRNYKTLQYL